MDIDERGMSVGLFGKNKIKQQIPVFDTESFEPVLRCSICTGEQVFCIIDRRTGEMHELQMIRVPADIDRICKANNIARDEVRKIY